MKRYVPIIALSLLFIGACSKKEESPVEQRQKTESTIHNVINKGEDISQSNAVQALESMPDGSPIESSVPHGATGKSTLASKIVHNIPLFKRSISKSPVDSITGTWQYVDSTDEWVHVSTDPSNGIVLLWDFKDTADVHHTAKAEFLSLTWYNDSLLTKADINLYVDNQKVAYLHYDLTLTNGVSAGVALDGAIVGELEFSVNIQAAEGHNLDESDFYGTIHISFSDLTTGESYALDVTSNEDGSGSFRFVYNDNEDNWEVYWTVSAPDATGAQTVSGYIKDNGTEVARIEGTIVDGDFSGIYIVYSDGTRVSISEYLTDIDVDGN